MVEKNKQQEQKLENVYVVFVADIDNLGVENVFVRKTVVEIFRNFVRISIFADFQLDSQMNCFHSKIAIGKMTDLACHVLIVPYAGANVKYK
jgi:hypothetical protein